MRRAGIEDLSTIVRVVRRLPLLRLSSDRPATVAMQWVADGGRTPNENLATNIPRRFNRKCESAGVVFAECCQS